MPVPVLDAFLFIILCNAHKKINKNINVHSSYRDLLLKHNGENATAEQKHFRILHSSLTWC